MQLPFPPQARPSSWRVDGRKRVPTRQVIVCAITAPVLVQSADGATTHVVPPASANASRNFAAIGSAIVQPSRGDGGVAADDTVATLFDFVPLNFGTTTVSILGMTVQIPNANQVDAAIARVTDNYNGGNREVHWVGYPKSLRRGAWGVFDKLGNFTNANPIHEVMHRLNIPQI